MRNGDWSVNVYRACSTTAPKQIPAANMISVAKNLAGFRFGRLLRARFGATFTDMRHPWVGGTRQ
jgi:hypothetical protein